MIFFILLGLLRVRICQRKFVDVKFKCLSCAGQLLYTRVTDKMHCAISCCLKSG